MKAPLVSVIMPAYNAEKYIEEAIRSVMAQTVTDWELVVIDDCSTDGTREVIKGLCAEEARIRYYENPENLGVAKTRNRGLDLAKGEYVALLDSDDVWTCEKLEAQLRLIKEKNAELVYCSYAMIDESGEKVCKDFIVPAETCFDDCLVMSPISCSTALFTQEIAREFRFPCDVPHEDLVFWLSILRKNSYACGLTGVFASYRLRKGSRSSDKLRCAIDKWRVYRGAASSSSCS